MKSITFLCIFEEIRLKFNLIRDLKKMNPYYILKSMSKIRRDIGFVKCSQKIKTGGLFDHPLNYILTYLIHSLTLSGMPMLSAIF